jgi:hypothetical protein
MPSTLTYPGVYIEEIPSGVRTIVGVATSIAAFIGRTERGPLNSATNLTSYADFERTFGNLSAQSPVGFAVRDFFLNGGFQAYVVRIWANVDHQTPATSAADGGLTFSASSAGQWGNDLRYACDQDGLKQNGPQFNLTVFRVDPKDPNNFFQLERFTKLTCDPTDRQFVKTILEANSLYLRASFSNPPGTLPEVAKAKKSLSSADPNTPLVAIPTNPANAPAGLYAAGIAALDKVDLFNLLCIPQDDRTDASSYGAILQPAYVGALAYCRKRRALLLVDPPRGWGDPISKRMDSGLKQNPRGKLGSDIGLQGVESANAALYYPWVMQPDPDQGNQPDAFPPCGVIAGIMARTDTTRGVWKAPAGVEASLTGVQNLPVVLTDGENGLLNPVGINCLRFFKVSGNVVWGARTLRGDDLLADDYKYVPIRRLALFLEESLYRGTKWAVFEPNDEPLWAQLRLNIGVFMRDLFRQGAFQGKSPQDAYFVKCDKDTTTQSDINKGIVNVLVGFAPLKPAEFVVLKFQQIAGQLQT